MEDRAFELELRAKLVGVDEVPVVSESHLALYVVDDDRLRVAAVGGTGRAVADVTERHIPLSELCELVGSEHVVDDTGVLIR